MKKILYLTAVILLFVSCKGDGSTFKPDSSGAPYEIIVIADDEMKQGMSYDTLVHILNQEVDMINQSEPIFNMVTMNPSNFKNILQKHRNLIILEAGAQYDTVSITIEEDVYARPQVLMKITGPTDAKLVDYIWSGKDNIVSFFESTERSRIVSAINKTYESSITDTIVSKFGYSMKLPVGYTIRNSEDNFLWISRETPSLSQGLFIYTYPYDGTYSIATEGATMIRDQFAALIPGPSDGSYMKTADVFPPEFSRLTVDGREWIVQRGFWDVANDFMGGPFVSFSTVDKANKRVVVVDTYLYYPDNRKTKRNMLRHIEAIPFTSVF